MHNVLRVLKLRQAALRVTGAKIERGLELTRGEARLRDLFTYHQAHTGRWSSRRMQLHNLPRGIVGLNYSLLVAEPTLANVDAEAERLGCSADDIIASLIRPTIVGIGAVGDYAQVELRCVAWMADDRAMLAALASGDPYMTLAKRLWGQVDKAKRQIAKVIQLGSIYGMSSRKFGEYCALRRIDLEAVNLTPAAAIDGFRDAFPQVPLMWRAFDAAARAAIRGETREVGRCVFAPGNGAMRLTLPSGRSIYYRQARIEMRPSKWDGKMREAIVYNGPHGERITYGSSLVENASQGSCRDILADALIRCEAAGLRPVAHVHDEIVIEGDAPSLQRIMSVGPRWADGFPLKVEVHSCERYVK